MIAEFDATLLLARGFDGWTFMRDNEGTHREQRFGYRFEVSPATVFADLDSPDGVQVLWRHGVTAWMGNDASHAIGRVRSMSAVGGALRGRLALSDDLMAPYVPTPFEAIEGGMNRGISIGFDEIDPVRLERGEGTTEDPHIYRFRRIQVREVSLTMLPRVLGCGIESRVPAS